MHIEQAPGSVLFEGTCAGAATPTPASPGVHIEQPDRYVATDQPSSTPAPAAGTLERLPKALNLVPIVVQWLWLAARYRSFTLPSNINPCLTTGGMVGDGKLEYLASMGAHALRATARTTSLIHSGPTALAQAEQALRDCGLDYPVAAKPDIGWCGFGVRRIADARELDAYLAAFPVGERVLLQEWFDCDGEAGVYYVREPGAARGQVVGLLLRHAPSVVGDGVRTVAELIAADPRTRRLGRDGASEAGCNTAWIPPAGEKVRVANVGSTRVGGHYEDASACITPALTAAFDTIAQDMQQFHVGRFDVKFAQLAELQAGTGFRIIEVNGAGSEAVHAWDPALSLWEAYRIIFRKQRRLFEIGDAMRQLGHSPVGLLHLWRQHRRQQAMLRRYPRSN